MTSPSGGAAAEGDEIVMWMQRRASSAYVPGYYRGPVDLVWASGAPGREPRPAPLDRWRRVAQQVRVHTIPASHIGLITEELPAFADVLRAILSR